MNNIKFDIIQSLNFRYATKVFDPSKIISQQDWDIIEKSLLLTPSSYGLQPWKFTVVKSNDIRSKLRLVSWNQSQITDASHLVVFSSKIKIDIAYIEKFIKLTATKRGIDESFIEQYKQMMIGDLVNGPRSKVIDIWASRQTYIALGNVMTVAATQGIDTCAIEGLDPVEYQKILSIPDDYKVLCACVFGYRSSDDKYASLAKVRFDKSDIIDYK
jgi:nitroreductase